MALGRGNNYFKMIEEQVTFTSKAAQALNKILVEYDTTKVKQDFADMHVIEHNADIKRHEIIKKLVKEFITPIEREDIMDLVQEIDNVVDSIEDVVIKLYIYNVKSIRSEALDFSKLIIKCCTTLETVCKEFENFRKSRIIMDEIIKINRLEEDGDKIHLDAIARLFRESSDCVELMAWRDIFESLENCCDTCEQVSEAIESVIMKNS